jgi:hypothetical protein
MQGLGRKRWGHSSWPLSEIILNKYLTQTIVNLLNLTAAETQPNPALRNLGQSIYLLRTSDSLNTTVRELALIAALLPQS